MEIEEARDVSLREGLRDGREWKMGKIEAPDFVKLTNFVASRPGCDHLRACNPGSFQIGSDR